VRPPARSRVHQWGARCRTYTVIDLQYKGAGRSGQTMYGICAIRVFLLRKSIVVSFFPNSFDERHSNDGCCRQTIFAQAGLQADNVSRALTQDLSFVYDAGKPFLANIGPSRKRIKVAGRDPLLRGNEQRVASD